MPARRRRRQQPGVLLDHRGRPLSEWKWFTFPVYFALAVGLFVGYDIGLLVVAPRMHTNWETVTTLVLAALFAFALSQLATRPFAQMLIRRRARRDQAQSNRNNLFLIRWQVSFTDTRVPRVADSSIEVIEQLDTANAAGR
jgi:hypothetical protein